MRQFARRGYDSIVGVVGYDFPRYEDLKLGDLVLRQDDAKPDTVMHRIIQRRAGGFVMAGNNNLGIDKNANGNANLLTAQNFRGRVTWIGVVE